MSASYLRYPHIHDDLVTFVAADDVWLAPVTGGRAWRLTDDSAPVRNPRFSPDGSRIAWTSTRDGHSEVMVVELATGSAERLTYWASPSTTVLGWTADGAVLVASSAGEANARHTMVKAVDLDGRVQRLPWGPVSGVAVHPNGPLVISTPGSRPPALWKRYRGGTASKLWLDRPGDGSSWQQLLPDDTAGLVSPVWVGDELVFASDREATFPDSADGQSNLWALDPLAEGEPRRITAHTAAQGYVRDPSGDGSRIVYHARGQLYLLESLAADAQPLSITLSSTVRGRRPRLLDPKQNLIAVRPDQGGDASLVEWRGKAFHLTHREGPARAVAADSGVRVRQARLLGAGGSVVMATDADGAASLEVRSLNGGGVRRLATGQLGRILHLASDPSGESVAVVSHDGRISRVLLDSGEIRLLAESQHGEATGLTFTPDGRWLAWSQPVGPFGHHQLMTTDLHSDSEPVALTTGRFDDTNPSFTLDGRYLAFLSGRTFDPRYDQHSFDLMFSSATRPYLVPLSATDPAPFGPSADGWRISKPPTAAAEPATEKLPEPGPGVHFDTENFEERLVPFPVPSGDYRDLQTAKDAVVWIHESADQGAIGSARAGVTDGEPADVVECWSFTRRELEVLVDKADSVAVSGDGERIVVLNDGAVTVRPADRKVADDDKERVEVDLSRLRFELDPVAEWRQMFDENAQIMADHYWRADMNGVDWNAAVARYRPLVSTLGSHDDLVDLLWETVAELNTSHAYVQPREPAGDKARRLGLLGADLSPAEGGWRIDRILPGESSDPEARSPLRAAGVGAKEGDLVVAVGGFPVDPRFGPAASLIGAVDKPVELTLRTDGDPKQDRRVVVVPIGSEETLRYQAWVASRRRYVAEHGRGRIGYLHIPDMMSVGWAQLHRDLETATRAEGLIVDVRYNRGGHTSQLVLERLARKVIGWNVARHVALAEPYPHQSPRGPLVFVTNEFAGSDGDIVNAGAQAMGLGPVIGSRTWGGVVGIDGRFDLVDGTGVTQPRYAFWLQGKQWGVENYGVDPDIEVVVSPAEWHGEPDLHLDRAISELLQRLESQPAAEPPPMPEPRVRSAGPIV
ncbi:MAG: tricorn protease [Propionibacteriaceae bacterium]|jgi:tricorn protease|nr:tricorn protease [Propionibacteriaceae bacterium]